MRTGRPTVAIVLTDAERKHLESLARRSRTAPGARTGQGRSRGQTLQQATRSAKLRSRAPWPRAVHAAVAALLLWGAAPAATVQAQDDTPSAPQNLAAVAGDTQVTITWDPPADDGGSDLTGYQIRGGLQTSWVSLSATETGPATFPNLENGREYTFDVRAVNDNGDGDIASVKATPRGAPSAPRNLAASPGDAQVTLTWSPPAEDGGADITGYQYQVDDGGWNGAGGADARSVVVSSGLENGQSYTFSLRAVNDVGEGAAATVDATPRATITAPSAPQNLAAEPGDTQVTLTWSPPANDGGADITGYEYQVDRGGWNGAGGADARSVVVSDLENLRQYSFSLRALNGGTEAGAAASVNATPRAATTAPSAPQNLAAVAGDTQVTITWDPPADDGGSDVTGYQIRGGLQTSWVSLSATETGPATFPNLENGREYTFEVRAVNEIGPGAIASVNATPRGTPSAPQNLAASPGDTEVTITWDPPAEDGGSDVTGYEFQVDQGDWKKADTNGARSLVVKELKNEQSYTFSLRAVNGIGPGASASVNATPRAKITTPSAPRDLAASPGNGKVTLTWSPPANDGGADVTGYEFQVDQGDWKDAGGADARSVVVDDLENGREYTLSLRAGNETGPGAVATVDATPRAAITAPSAPRNLAASPGNALVTITWEPPADDGGSALTGYQMRGGLQTSWVTLQATETGPATFPNLENGREYTFEVRAVNDIGPGPTASVNATPRAAPTAPRNLAASPRDARVTLTWEPPAEDGGAAITGYQYQVDQEGWINAGTAAARSVVVTDLKNEQSYTFSLRAVNGLGPGAVEMVEATPRSGADAVAPKPPRNVRVSPRDTTATLTWEPPADDGGSDVTGYQYQVDRTDGGSDVTGYEYQVDRTDWKDAGTADARSADVTGLENGRDYTFAVRALNGIGPGAADTVEATPRPGAIAPTAPRGLAAVPGDAEMTLTWSPPANDGGSAVTGYQYQVDQGAWINAGAAAVRSVVVSGLKSVRSYAFAVRAVNGTGPGAVATVQATPRAAATVPSAPRNLAAAPGDAEVTLTWEPSANDGGSAVTGYQYQVDRGGWKSAGAAAARSVVVRGLENGRRYTFAVRAVNGTGPGAVATVRATPRTVPSAPRNLAAAPGDAEVTLTWEPPADDGGSAVTGYQYQVDRGGWKSAGAAAARSVTVTGLENGRRYTFAVRAVSRTGPGAVATVRATPRTEPSAPRNLAAAPGDAEVTLTWEPPADDGGSAVTGYQYRVDQGGWKSAGAAAARSVTVTGLENGRQYTFAVRAVNGAGSGPPAEVTARLNRSPVFERSTYSFELPEHRDGSAQPVELGSVTAEDPDGDELTYGLSSGDRERFAVGSQDGALTYIGPGESLEREPNRYDLTVLARDSFGAEALAQVVVTVTVNERLVRAVAGDTLAAMGRGHLASARMTLGRRVTAGRGEQSRLTVLGQSVPLGTAAAHAAAERMALSLLSPMDTATYGAPGRGLGLSSPAGRQPGAAPAPGGSSGGWNQGLTGTSFLLAQGDGDPGEARPAGRFTVWGQGDVQMFRGTPSAVTGYEGDVRTAYLGIDSRLTDRWLAGVALARSWAAGDWHAGTARGRMTTTLTAVHPYLHWSDGATSVWTMVGGGRGTAANERAVTGGQETSGLELRLGLVEARRRLGTVGGGVQLGLRGDAAWAQLTTEAGDEAIDALRVEVNQVRAGVELTRPFRMSNGLALAPFGELNLRRDGGAGQGGDGLEVAGGLRASGGTIRVDAQARLLALHSADGYQERGASLTFSVGEGARRPGLTLSLAPRWGNGASSGALWQDHVHRRYAPGAAAEERAMDARVDYGVPSFGGRLLTSFGVYGQSQYGRRLQVGIRLGSLTGATNEFLQVEMSGERYSRPGGPADNRVSLSGLITFGGRDRNVEASRGLRSTFAAIGEAPAGKDSRRQRLHPTCTLFPANPKPPSP